MSLRWLGRSQYARNIPLTNPVRINPGLERLPAKCEPGEELEPGESRDYRLIILVEE
jgi:hypothetical protein